MGKSVDIGIVWCLGIDNNVAFVLLFVFGVLVSKLKLSHVGYLSFESYVEFYDFIFENIGHRFRIRDYTFD